MPRQARPATRAAASPCLTWALDPGRLGQPEPCADLGHSHQRDGQQPGLGVGQAGVLVDHRGDHRGALAGDPVDALADRGLVGQVGLEHQPEGAGVAGDVLEEDVHGRRDPLLVVVGRLQRRTAVVDDVVARGVEQGEVEVELAGEVLVEHGLGDAGAVGDVVHGGSVEALGDEDLEGRLEQLGAAFGARQPPAPGSPGQYRSPAESRPRHPRSRAYSAVRPVRMTGRDAVHAAPAREHGRPRSRCPGDDHRTTRLEQTCPSLPSWSPPTS